MNLYSFLFNILCYASVNLLFVQAFEPFSILGVGALLGGSAVVYNTFDFLKENSYCRYRECCNAEYVQNNFHLLESRIRNYVYGQHLVVDTVVPALRGHIENPNPSKPLVMSFHGWPGSGKNYVAQFIIDGLYKKGIESSYVHFYNGGINFPLADQLHSYQTNLVADIKKAVSACPQSLFVFDEVDKTPPGLLDAITPLLDYNRKVDGVDYTKAIFIFLSNKGGSEISSHLLSIWNSGLTREDTKLAHFEPLIQHGAFKEEVIDSWMHTFPFVRFLYDIQSRLLPLFFKGGFKNSNNIKRSVIDHYIPFFPMERRHVKQCAEYEFKTRHEVPTEESLEEVLSYMTYGPEPSKLFSNSGCKRVANKVATVIKKSKMGGIYIV